MTIHWKAIDDHLLMVPSVFHFNHFWVKNAFSEFFSEKTGLKQLKPNIRHPILI
jgi:hypothetical protein